MPKAAPAATATKSRSRRANKDTEAAAPKRPLSAYMFFSQEFRARVKSQNPEATFGQIGKILGEMWRNMADEQKSPFTQKAQQDKARYNKEMAAFGKTKA
ncbi:Non-histone chromosomal protein 6 [Spiromyces aspiralis]|uniref:Non-histone chromosomal protein 6 n=1 Tax=Spiromyces aspiralis TaxID=68401 RepID=A0ACC1HNV7_9FUNG|nr:Non-histone chromosomal protein 6 [Spiromyces aspiralis]